MGKQTAQSRRKTQIWWIAAQWSKPRSGHSFQSWSSSAQALGKGAPFSDELTSLTLHGDKSIQPGQGRQVSWSSSQLPEVLKHTQDIWAAKESVWQEFIQMLHVFLILLHCSAGRQSVTHELGNAHCYHCWTCCFPKLCSLSFGFVRGVNGSPEYCLPSWIPLSQNLLQNAQPTTDYLPHTLII